MGQRTLAQARQMLEDNASLMNPPTYKEMEVQLNEASAAAGALAATYISDRYNEAVSGCVSAGKGLCQLRDAARVLNADLAAGRIDARQGTARWNELKAQARRLNAQTDSLAAIAETIGEIEADPVAWYDQAFYERYPLLRPHFSF